MNQREQVEHEAMVLELAIARRAAIDAQAATKHAERTTRLVQNQHDKAAAEATANRKRFCETIDTKNAKLANLEADNARLRRQLVDHEDRYNDLVQRCIGARSLGWARKHGLID